MQSQTCGKSLTLHGTVQGVGMRYFLMGNARALGLAGWVRNRSDGSVECIVQGDCESVDQFVQAAEQGPPAARIAAIDIQPVAVQPDLHKFSIRY